MMSRIDDLTENYKYLQFSDAASDGEYLWTVAENFNAIYKIRKSDFTTEFVCQVPDEDELGVELYASGVVKCGRKLYLIPGTAKKIAIYHMDDSKYTYLSTEEMQGDHYPKFGVVIQRENYIYLFPQSLPVLYILKIDVQTDTMERIEFAMDFDIPRDRNDVSFFGCSAGEDIWFGVAYPGIIGKFNYATNSVSFIELTTTDSYIYQIAEHGGILYLLTLQNEVIAYDPKNEKEYTVWKDDSEELEQYSRIIYLENTLWLFPFKSNHIVRLNADKKEMAEYIEIPDSVIAWKKWGVYGRKYYGYHAEDNMLYLYPDTTNTLLKISMENGEIIPYTLCTHREKILRKQFIKQELNHLYYKDDLQYLIDLLVSEEGENGYEVD